MNRLDWTQFGKLALLAGALIATAAIREGESGVVTQAIIWLPSGVALAGLWLLGFRVWWVVALCTLGQRAALGYEIQVSVSAALGSVAEAVVGVLVLRRLHFHASLARLRDVLALFAAAALAPLGSIFFSWIGRSYLWTNPGMPFYSGWDGWWRMNALGVLAAVPPILTWFSRPDETPGTRFVGKTTMTAAGMIALFFCLMVTGPAGITGALMLNLGLLLALCAAIRFGPRGAALAGALSAITVVVVTTRGLGPFVAIAMEERHVALQVFELTLVAVPLVFGALIAERQAALARGLRSEALRHSTLEALPDITLRLREGGLCVDLYVPVGVVGPFTRQDVVGQFTRDFLPPDAAEILEKTSGQVLAAQAPVTVEFSLEAAGRRRAFETRCVPYGDDEILAVVREITDRKCLEEQLRQSQKMEAVGKLAGGVAHDFNNLLTAIFGYAEAIRDAMPATSAVHTYAAEVLHAAERAAGLTHQLLAYSRQQVLSPQAIELNAVVESLSGMLRRLVGEDINLVTGYSREECWARVDRGQLEQVILNLVVNARDAMPAGGTLTLGSQLVDVDETLVRTHVDLHLGPYVALTVRDDGTGMPGEVQVRAFDPFFTTKEQGKGTGLGLSTVYGIVKQSGGVVWLESQLGVGTTVWICLPRVEAANRIETAVPPLPAETAGATVLLVEDEPVVRELARRVLTKAGYDVLDAFDGARAIDVSRSHRGAIDVMVTDVVMPRLGGRELASRLLAERPGLRVLFISGYPSEAGDLREFAGPVGDFLQKPFAPHELVSHVRALLQVRSVDR